MSDVIKWALAGTFGSIVAITALQMVFKEDGGQRAVFVKQATDKTVIASTKADSSPLSSHLVQACKATLAVMNSHDAKIFKGYSFDDVTAHVSWVRPDDGKRWQARCEMVDDNHIRWAAFDAFGDGKQGRWRDEDSIEVTIKADAVVIELQQAGMELSQKSFKLRELS